MLRKIIKIDKEKCNGCGLCVTACHEGAIGMSDGKAQLLRDDYCDGLGDCLPVCPTDAITFEEREALAYNDAEVKKNMEQKKSEQNNKQPCGCPGTNAKMINRECSSTPKAETHNESQKISELKQWPVQIKLVSPNARFFKDAHLLIAADCTAYASGDFHNKFMKNKITIIGCPKLDDCDYSEKLTAIIRENDIKSLTVVRMEVPCCGGIEHAVKVALKNSDKMIPWQVVVLSTDGEIMEV